LAVVGRRRFSLVHGSFAKKEAALQARIDVLEAGAASARAAADLHRQELAAACEEVLAAKR
jgi:hypothetical protein